MHFWRSAFLVKITLFFFLSMLLFHPAYAQQVAPASHNAVLAPAQNSFPVIYLNEEEAQQRIWDVQRQGYVVKQGTLAQLEEMKVDGDVDVDGEEKQEIKEQKEQKEQPNKDCVDITSEAENEEPIGQQDGEKMSVSDSAGQAAEKSAKPKCTAEKTAEETDQAQEDVTEGVRLPEPVPEPVPPTPAYPQAEVHGGVGVQVNLSGSGGGRDGDLAKVFFIFAGFVVVAAFVVYVGKYISDIVAGKDVSLWRELVFNSSFLSTDAGQSGEFVGAKLALGFVSSELIQLALVGELGKTHLDLVLNEHTRPTPLNLSASYWMLGATARLHLTDTLVNASYLYLDFMGGTTSNNATDLIGAARLGASFGLNDYLRLGASLGAQYIGLDEDQGFANDGDNYWLTYGVEIGARF